MCYPVAYHLHEISTRMQVLFLFLDPNAKLRGNLERASLILSINASFDSSGLEGRLGLVSLRLSMRVLAATAKDHDGTLSGR